ncbi:MAG: hypothetical protein KatS3mg072_0951 [Meiothermus sp.]|nr:MAG: hypothetical protein KatS3mg072_0951 [Meiothermus sp.]
MGGGSLLILLELRQILENQVGVVLANFARSYSSSDR